MCPKRNELARHAPIHAIQEQTMENRFKKVILHKSEKADETWINLDHIVAVTPDPRNRFMVVVLDVIGSGWGTKVYKITIESGQELLEI